MPNHFPISFHVWNTATTNAEKFSPLSPLSPSLPPSLSPAMAAVSPSADTIDPSQTSEPPQATETTDRNDPFSSTPSPVGLVDPQKSSAPSLRSEEYRQLFRLPVDEVLIQDFNCALQENILLQGHLYMFVHYVCFYSNIFGFETKKIIPFNEVSCVRKSKTAGIFPNAIEILADERKYFFASFLSRDEAFKLINDGLLEHRSFVEARIDQQELRFVGEGSGVIEIERMGNSKHSIDELNSRYFEERGTVQEDLRLPPSGEDEGATVSKTLSEGRDNAKGLAEVVSKSVVPSSSSKKEIWMEEDLDAPKIPDHYSNVAESKFKMKAEEFFLLFFSDGALDFFESFHGRCGDKDARCTLWKPHDEFGYVRDVSFRHPIKAFYGARFGSCQEAQTFRIYRNSHLIITTSQEINDAPYGSYFCVKGLWDVASDCDETGESCIVRVYSTVEFHKNTIMKWKIEQATAEECRETFATWINIAHELLKQRSLQKQGEGSSKAIRILSGHDEAEMHNKPVEMQSIPGAPSEGTHQAADQTRHPQTVSDSQYVNQGIDDSVWGSPIDAASSNPLLKELAVKFNLFLKRNKVALFLVVIFAVIFLMQVSIVALLMRPPPAVHVGLSGSVLVDRSPDAVAWLQQRIRHLNNEMAMAEVWFERMRREQSLLKAQIEDLGQGQLHEQR